MIIFLVLLILFLVFLFVFDPFCNFGTVRDCGGFGVKDPGTEAAKMIMDYQNKPSELKIVEKVTFKKDDSLNAVSIADRTKSLTKEQICLSKGDLENNADFEKVGSVIRYKGTSRKQVNLLVVCDIASDLKTNLSENYADYATYADDCASNNNSTDSSTLCLIALKAT